MLCQLADVHTYLGLTSTNEDANINALIAAASAWIEKYCNRTFEQAQYSEVRNGNGAAAMYLRQRPVTAVASVTVDGYAIPVPQSTTSYGYVFDASCVYIRAGIKGSPAPFNGAGLRFTRGVQNIVVSYTAGYATIPPDLVQACVELVAWKRAKASRIDKTSETLGQAQTQAFAKDAIPPSVLSALNNHLLPMYPP